MKLEEIKVGSQLSGIDPAGICSIRAVNQIAADAIEVFYKTPDGTTKERLINRLEAESINEAVVERPWAFDGDGEKFILAVEAKRIDLAYLFDPLMAVHTSNVDPLPHQITAVYESMLPRQPLRYILADDPGAGKTIMAGLYIRELLMRADARRVLIVAPGSLVEQWKEELFQKFGLEFLVYPKEIEKATPSGNPFEDLDQVIVRLDQCSRDEDVQERICATQWDLVVFDEAHKLAAHYYGQEVKRVIRHGL
jgi:SNF2 family DNA or RNA helicase